ncbi:hypothetical protein X802_03700 [Thermococcus guaymasensis DSM 11113]|uniref:Uncharacterized protein n=1 Tax=Thermococcus guaymasensis DSM 11113 TaxID=1432656 RepID=A0A0X1KN46_9EURY|nr:hypothetical protein X802_03700 [Thermococcus guaymasensis DSM 11113]
MKAPRKYFGLFPREKVERVIEEIEAGVICEV